LWKYPSSSCTKFYRGIYTRGSKEHVRKATILFRVENHAEYAIFDSRIWLVREERKSVVATLQGFLRLGFPWDVRTQCLGIVSNSRRDALEDSVDFRRTEAKRLLEGSSDTKGSIATKHRRIFCTSAPKDSE